MKKNLQIGKKIALALILLVTATAVNAQTRTASVDGPWSSTTTWGGASVPTSANDVVINNGIDVTVPADAACNSITFSSAAGSISVNSGFTLAVTGAITLQNAATGNRAATLTGAGTLTCASMVVGGTTLAPNLTGDGLTTLTCTVAVLSVSGNISLRGVDDGADDNNPSFILNSGSLTVSGTVVLNQDAGSAVTFNLNGGGAETGTLNLPGATPFTVTGGATFDANGTASTVNYSGAAQTILSGTYRNLVLSGSGTKTTTGVTVNGKLSVGDVTVGNAITYSTAILEYNGTAAQTTSNNEFAASTSSIDEVIINNTAGVTLNAAKTLNGDLTLTAGTLVAGTNLTMGAGGTPMITRSEGSMTGTLQGTSDYDVTYTGTNKTTGPELNNGGLRDVTINLTAGQTLTLDATRTPDGNLSVSAGTLDLSSFTINRTAAGGTLTVSNGATLRIGSTNAFVGNYSTHSIGATSTVEYAGTAQTVSTLNTGQSYGNLILSGSGLKTFTGETVVGTLFLRGTATTTGTTVYGASATLAYEGSALQTTGSEFPAASGPRNLTINNSSNVTLSAARTIVGALTLTNGDLGTNNTNLLTIAAGGTTSGGSASSHVNGPLSKTGNTNFTFPVGNGTIYRPISISSISLSATVRATYFLANPRTAFGTTGTGTALPIKDVSLCEYWDLDDGAATITAIVGLQYSSTSPCNSGGYIGDPASLVVAHWNTTTLTWENKGATGATTLTNMTANVTSTFSPFTIGTTDAGLNGLPVTFTDVKAAEKGSAVQIDWTNSTESDMSTYVIERSANGIDFTAIGQTAPRSNQFDRVSYTYLDAAPLAGTNFYRIKAVEITGKNVYSRSLRVDIGRSPKGISLYPNPVRGSEIIIGFNASKGQYSLNVVNTAGQLVFKQLVNHAGGTVAQTVNLPASLKSGVYNLLISGDNYKETKMFVIQ